MIGHNQPPSQASLGADCASERRRHRRFFPRTCELSLAPATNGFLKFLASPKRTLALSLTDLSESGARFVLRGQWAAGKRVKVHIHVKLFNDAIEMDGRIVWCFEHGQRYGCYHTGVRFEPVTSAQAWKIASLRDYLNSPEFRRKEATRNRLHPDYDASAIEFDV